MCILSVACIVSLICFVHESYPNYSSCCFVACRLWHISKYQSKKNSFCPEFAVVVLNFGFFFSLHSILCGYVYAFDHPRI